MNTAFMAGADLKTNFTARPGTAGYRAPRPTESTLIIDYPLFATLPSDSGSQPPPVIPTGGPAPAHGEAAGPPLVPPIIQDPAQMRGRELKDMRKELQDIKPQVAEQEAERNAQKQKGSSKQKPPSTP